MGDAAFARVLGIALENTKLTREVSDAGHWAVYDPKVGRWITAPVCAPLHALTLH